VGGGEVVVTGNGFVGGQFVAGLRVFVSSVKKDVRGIVMHFGQRHAEFFRDVQGERRENGMTLGKEGVECFAEPIVVEFFSGDVPQELGPGVFGPLGDVDESEWAKHPGGDEDGEDVPVREFRLGIGREMLVDDLGDVHSLEQRRNDGEGADVASFNVGVGLVSIPRRIVHPRSVTNSRKAS